MAWFRCMASIAIAAWQPVSHTYLCALTAFDVRLLNNHMHIIWNRQPDLCCVCSWLDRRLRIEEKYVSPVQGVHRLMLPCLDVAMLQVLQKLSSVCACGKKLKMSRSKFFLGLFDSLNTSSAKPSQSFKKLAHT